MSLERIPQNEDEERKSRLVELIKEKGFESNEAQKAVIEWGLVGQHKVQRARNPEEQGKLDALLRARLKFLNDICAEGESFENIREQLFKYDEQHKSEDYGIARISDRVGEIALDIDFAEIYSRAGLHSEARESLEFTKIAAYQEWDEAVTDEERRRIDALLEEIEVGIFNNTPGHGYQSEDDGQ